ncbi:UNVERIFIED_CONTAM: hypothetical protein Slati_4154000 [Sesamum latifolium]|uniref:Reverse transcriptase domain-containing protein n=1 Tax=Sesamum latifolium TaxID=2727402 RepID=A0AAW2T8M5_9LAMI
MFKSTRPSDDVLETILGCLDDRVTTAMNDALLQSFTSEEVTWALNQMHPLKYPGLTLDVSKAYDQVEWRFLESVLLRLGFHRKFVSLVMTCVSSVSFSFLLNEALSGMLYRAESMGLIQGIAISRSAPRVSYLLFADDTLIFCPATTEAMSCIRQILEDFEWASGLRINSEKSAIVFSRNVNEDRRWDLASILGVMVVPRHDKYLGLPTISGRSKKELFEGIKERIWGKLNSWASRKLSQAGRTVLLKSVIQTVPTYSMNCFRLLDSLLRDLESLMANFFWNCGTESKILWKACPKLC